MRNFLTVLVLSLVLLLDLAGQNNSVLKLWYNRPAGQWVEALPLGNGRLGAMIFGDPSCEKIQLNENTVWAGQPNRNDNPDAKAALPLIRKLIFEGRYKEAQDLANQKVISKTSQGMPYQTVGNLNLVFPGLEKFSNYYRELNLEKAVATIKYTSNEINFNREVFTSFPDQVIVVRLTADKPGRLTFLLSWILRQM